MRIFLTGATGFIGGHTLRALLAGGHEVSCLTRKTTRRLPVHANLRVVEGEWTSPSGWLTQVPGHEAVINTVGIIRTAPGADFKVVHSTSPIALFEAAARAGVTKIVQLSALGADDAAVSRYHLSKREADRRLMQLGAPYVILRPSFVYGPGDHSMTFFSRLAALPLTPVPGDGQYLVQPVAVRDVVQAIQRAVEREELSDIVADMGGGETLTFDALLDRLALSLGKRCGARKIHIPWPLMRLVARMTDALGGHGPITRDELRMLQQGSFTDNRPFIHGFGFEPAKFDYTPAR